MKNIVIILLMLFIIYYINKSFTRKNKSYIRFKILDEIDRNIILRMINDGDYESIKKYIRSNLNINRKIKELLGNKYEFQDYIYTIEKSKISTCHRDENGQFFNKNLKNPSYTIIFYLEPSKACLDVIEGSHKHNLPVYITNPTSTIKCEPGDAILFNSDTIHKGSDNVNTKRVQMKIHHIDDEFIEDYSNYNKKLKPKSSIWDGLSFLTCRFPIIGDLTKNGRRLYDYELFS